MAERSRLAQLVYDAALPRIEELGLELIDVEIERQGNKRTLRIYIDKTGGVSLDDCTAVSRMMDPIIDQDLKIKEHDYFEVSSPGLERPLKTAGDFLRYQGEWVEVSLYRAVDGQKKYQGILEPCPEDAIVIRLENQDIRSFARSEVSRARRIVKI